MQNPRILVFFQSSRLCSLATAFFKKFEFPFGELHGKKTANQRMRTFKYFRQDRFPVLFASDVIARGIDINDVQLIIHVGIPRNIINYKHRIGRTGRMGKAGKSNSGFFLTLPKRKLLSQATLRKKCLCRRNFNMKTENSGQSE